MPGNVFLPAAVSGPPKDSDAPAGTTPSERQHVTEPIRYPI
jgi:hypothetical protein